MASIVDRPKKEDKDDLLGIEKYTKGLINFIEHSETPITIGIQGEWGSGKTSLLNTIKYELCEKEDAKFYPIWLNTWEYSLLSSPDETLIKIISGLVLQISELADTSTKEKLKDGLDKVGSAISFIGKTFGGTAGQIAEEAGKAIKSSVNKTHDNSIKALRDALQEIINKTIEGRKEKKAFIFFIDDLDRLDPTVAVNILELIKNLFDLEKCIFVLAIDYSVVVKGLQSKFGAMTEENEWEFRAFFDKIIQLPFSMPISSYDISKYLKSLLIDVKYFKKIDLDNEKTLEKIVEIVGYSVSTNPRALVRLTNSVSLIEMIRTNEDKITTEERVIEFALVCMQIAYPLIYGLVQKDPEFIEWGKEETLDILKSKNIDGSELEDIKISPEFDESWEQELWRVCQLNSFLKQNVYRVSKLLNFINSNTPKSDENSMGDTLEKLLKMSSFTSVSTDTSKPQKRVRLSPKQKKEFLTTMKKLVQEKIQNNHLNLDFKFHAKAEIRNTWVNLQIDTYNFDVCVWTNQKNIKVYVNAKTSSSDIITLFKKYMSDTYGQMEFNEQAKDGKKVVILETYSLDNPKQFMEAYQKAVVTTYNNILSKVVN
jgi:ABC-type phosphonate transport system ATPase subunit